MPDYLPYSPSVEKPAPDEHVTFDEISRLMQHITRKMASEYRHAYRPVHAKSHGLLVGTLEVLPGLPPELAQGLFAQPAAYPVLFRFSTNPGDILSDKVSTPKGLAIKVMNVPGEQLPSNQGNTTQDFVCVNSKVFNAPDAKGFLEGIKLFDKTLNVSDGVKEVVSTVARAANTVLSAVHVNSPALEGLGAPAVHILGETFSTVAPLRYGSYIAKLAFVPASENLKELTGKSVDISQGFNALEDMIKDFFRHQSGVWEVQVQLALVEDASLELKEQSFPIEKADTQWPEEAKGSKPGSPYVTVARITMPAQDSYSDDRQLFVDEQLSFTPWHGLAAHQPLGGIMRSRLKAYAEAAKFRAMRNKREAIEPKSADEIPR